MIFHFGSPDQDQHSTLPKFAFLHLLIKLGDFYLFQLLSEAFHNLQVQGFPNFTSCHLGILLKCRFFFNRSGWSLRYCMSNSLLGAAEVAGSQVHFE